MCRVALMNKEGLMLIEKEYGYGIGNFFSYLEMMNGGHGNGISFLLNNNRIITRKGLDWDEVKICKLINKYIHDIEWVLFHTRISSVGVVNDENCHPYKEGKYILAMNGTVSGFSDLGAALGITDTHLIAKTFGKLDLSPRHLKELGAVFMGYYDKTPFVTVNNEYKDLEIINEGNALVFASEFPKELKDMVQYPAKYPFSWMLGDKLELVKEKKKAWEKYYYYGNYKYYDYDNTDYSWYSKSIKGVK